MLGSCHPKHIAGIAAANIEIDGTGVSAATIHNVFDLDSDYKSSLDFSKPSVEKVGALLGLRVLLLDEARAFSMCARTSTVHQ